jgi:hypothetical protein
MQAGASIPFAVSWTSGCARDPKKRFFLDDLNAETVMVVCVRREGGGFIFEGERERDVERQGEGGRETDKGAEEKGENERKKGEREKEREKHGERERHARVLDRPQARGGDEGETETETQEQRDT